MKTAIVGSSGYIAHHIYKKFCEISKIESVLKIDKVGKIDEYLDLAAPEIFNYDILKGIEYIVFAAAISGPDMCAREFEVCWKINVIGTIHFINEAIKRNCKVLFLSSDAVFGDAPGKIYDENSKTEAYTPYGKMKKAVEDEFRNEQKFKAIRLSYVVSSTDRFMIYCMKCIKNGEVADIFHPFYRNVTVISDVIEVILYLALHWDEYVPRFLNVAGKELVSRIRIADEINRFFNGKLKYIISIPSKDFFENRPKITQMKSLYLEKYNILDDGSFTEKIAKEFEKMEK